MRDKELRLALVCYGGISLAVYMHGITKEIWRLARASERRASGQQPETGSEAVYAELLDTIAEDADLRVRVLVDIVAGASAGGINGVFLAQAISTGQSLEPLTDLWLDLADVEQLIDKDQAPATAFTKFWARPLAWMALGNDAVEESVEATARDEVRDKLDHFIRSRWFEPPFGGKRLLNMLLDAFDAMATQPCGPRLLPPGQPLDLFVTVTDFGGHPERLRLNSPPEVVETEHRLVIDFTDRGDAADGGNATALAHPAELAFAARATSSFPGAFPPFTVGELDAVLAERGTDWPGRSAFLAETLPRHVATNSVDKAALIDGSVLANAPFRPAIDALRQRPARRQIDRRFVFIDPWPGLKFTFGGTPDGPPGFFKTLIGALSEIPRQQPIRDNLEAITDRSDRIEGMLGILERMRAETEQQIETLFGYTLFLDYPTPRRLKAWRQRAQAGAARSAGFAHASYSMVKLDSVIDRIATLVQAIAGDGGQERWRRNRSAIAAAAAGRGAEEIGSAHPTGASDRAVAFLRGFDVGFRIRRLRLLIRRIAEIDADRDRAELRLVREAVYGSLAAYLDCQRSEHFPGFAEAARALSDANGAAALLDRLETAMDLRALDAATDAALSRALSSLDRDLRRPLLLAYLGFPYFDVATLPLLQGEGLDEFDPIRVDRIAPDDAGSIRSGGAEATLKGIHFNSFGAFFSRAYRENDYLWGRLHGAERVIDITVSTLPSATRLKPGRVTALKRAAFRAILDEEEPRLTAIPALFQQLRAEIG